MTYAEVASLKGVSVRTVKNWPKRGLKVIRRSHCDVEITPDALARFEEKQSKKFAHYNY